MSDRLLAITREAPAEESTPAADRILDGAPVHRTWNLESTGDGLHAGLWESTPGEWRVVYTEWEFFHVVAGVSILAEDGGGETTLRAGDAFVIRPGFRGRWRVLETTLKHYVVRE